MKRILKRILRLSPVALTKNQHYDRLTKRIIRKVCGPESNCIDVGCHKGEILDLMLEAAPAGKHWGFEPIPAFYKALREKYHGTQCIISPIALSDKSGEASFNFVTTNPSYSGLQKRTYDRPNEQDERITVATARLDEVLPAGYRANLIKIDVEGGEMLVLEGARETIKRGQAVVIFEHGIGGADVYGFGPGDVWRYFDSQRYGIYLLEDFLAGRAPQTADGFEMQFRSRKNFYFVAAPLSNTVWISNTA